MPAATTSQPTANPNTGATAERFSGFEHLTANFLYCPNQFFDVCLPHYSRGVIRLVAYALRRTLGWLDRNGNPIEQNISVSYRELIDRAGISRGAIRPALDAAIAAGFIDCTEQGQPNRRSHTGKSSQYVLRWDMEGGYVKTPDTFRGFYAGEGNRTPIPNAFFDRVVRSEPLAVTKVVGTVLRHTVGYQNQFGGRRSDAPLSYSYVQHYANIGDRSTLSDALERATTSGYIRRMSKGIFSPDSRKRRPATYAVNWLPKDAAEMNSSKTRPADPEQFKNPTRKSSKSPLAEQFKNPTTEKTHPNNTSKQQHALPAIAAEKTRAYELLRSAGFDDTIAAQLAKGRGVEEIERQIAWLPKRNPARNRLGLLRRAIEENWSQPTAAEDARRREAARESDQSDVAKEATDIAERQKHRKHLLDRWISLSQEERLTATERALGSVESRFVRERIARWRKRGSPDETPLDVLLYLEPYLAT